MVSIYHSSFPHIVEAILSNVPRGLLPSLRGLSRSVRDFVDAQLARHVVLHPARLTLADVATLFGTPPPLFAASAGTMFAVDLGASPPAPQATATAVTLSAQYFTVTPVVRDNLQLAPVIKQRLARDEAALAHAQIVDLVGDISPTYWGMIPRATTVRIFPASIEDQIARSAFLALEALRPDTAVLFTRPGRQYKHGLPPGQLLWHEDPRNHPAPRHLEFPKTRRLVVHVTPPKGAYPNNGRDCDLEVWTPPGRGGFQADDEIVYIFHEDWRVAWQYHYPPTYLWRENGGSPLGRPHRSLPLWVGSQGVLTPLFVALGEALEHIPRVRVVGLDEIPLRVMMLCSPYRHKRFEAMREMPFKVIKRACEVANLNLNRWDSEYDSDEDRSELMYRIVFSDIVKDPHATVDDIRDYVDAQVRAGTSVNTIYWQEQRQGDLRHCYTKFLQNLIECMQCASLEQHCPDDPDQVLFFQPPEAWDRHRFAQLVRDKVSFLTHDAYRDMVGDEQWRVETTAHPWPPKQRPSNESVL